MSAPAIISTKAPEVNASSDGGITDEQWAKNSWDGRDPQADEDAELDAILAAEESGDDADESEEEPEPAKNKQPAAKADKPDPKVKADEKTAQKAKEKAPEPEAKAPEKAPAPKAYKVKLGGDEREIESGRMARALGVSEATLAQLEPGAAERLYQRDWLAQQRTDEGTKALQQFQSFMANIKGNPVPALQALLSHEGIGHDLKAIATQVLTDEFEYQRLPEPERELRRAKAELDRLKADQERQRQEAAAQADQQRRRDFALQLANEIKGALTEAGLPTHGRLSSRMVSLMQRERAERDDSVSPYSTPKELVSALRKEIAEDLQIFTQGLEPEALEGFLGESIVAALGDVRVKRFRANQAAQMRQPDLTITPRRNQPAKRKVTFDDIMDSL